MYAALAASIHEEREAVFRITIHNLNAGTKLANTLDDLFPVAFGKLIWPTSAV